MFYWLGNIRYYFDMIFNINLINLKREDSKNEKQSNTRLTVSPAKYFVLLIFPRAWVRSGIIKMHVHGLKEHGYWSFHYTLLRAL